MKRLLLITLVVLTPLLALGNPPPTFKQTLARVAAEREPGLMPDIYGEYAVSKSTFWAAVIEFLGPERLENFPPYTGTPEGIAWRKAYPGVQIYLDSPAVFVGNPNPLQRLWIAKFLMTYYYEPQ